VRDMGCLPVQPQGSTVLLRQPMVARAACIPRCSAWIGFQSRPSYLHLGSLFSRSGASSPNPDRPAMAIQPALVDQVEGRNSPPGFRPASPAITLLCPT
jgi:hypothetical protein